MARLRSTVRELVDLFEASAVPVYAVDDRRKLVYCNAACCGWLSIEPEQLLGRQCDYSSGDLDTAPWSVLCPPPDAFLGQPLCADLVWSQEKSIQSWRVQFVPLGAELDCVGVVAIGLGAIRPADRAPPALDELDSHELHRQLQLAAQENRQRFRLDRLVGNSPAMQRVRAQIRLAIAVPTAVLVVGPPGCGREHVARTIHAAVPDPGSLMPISCALLDDDLFRSTARAFFSHVRPAGSAPLPTLLLLDADRLSAASQADLRKMLKGAPAVRLLTTASRTLITSGDDLQEPVFDQELAHLLSPLVIELPPLSRRREDIPYLAQQLLESRNAAQQAQMSGFMPEVLDLLTALPWPRNLDELTEVVDAACRHAGGAWVRPEDLPERVRVTVSAAAHPRHEEEAIELDRFLEDVERELIWRALNRSKGNKAEAARRLGINRARLLRRISHLGLEETSSTD